MVRVRAPGCLWKSGSLDAVARIAGAYGYGSLHFTTRGDVELHGVKFSDIDLVQDRIRLAGLKGRGGCGDAVRNVVACAGSGVCPEEKYDVAELARRIAGEYTGCAAFEHLPENSRYRSPAARRRVPALRSRI
jgi:sulfite reductase (ferredoxin)